MPKKTWTVLHQALQIEFRNSWSFAGKSEEQLLINGIVQDSRKISASDGFKSSIVTRYTLSTKADEKDYLVEVKVGSKWHGLSIGCHIFVDGELIGGDVDSKLLFT